MSLVHKGEARDHSNTIIIDNIFLYQVVMEIMRNDKRKKKIGTTNYG